MWIGHNSLNHSFIIGDEDYFQDFVVIINTSVGTFVYVNLSTIEIWDWIILCYGWLS